MVEIASAERALDPDAVAAAAETLARLPCPSVALATGTAPQLPLLARFDTVVASHRELALIVATVERAPLAAMTLAQLLRHSEALDPHEGLIAESLAYSTLQSGPEFGDWLARRGPPQPAPAAREPAVLARRDGECLELTLNRPERHNAFSLAMRDALVEGLEIAASDPSIRELVLRGRGASFCSGGDLDEFGTLPDPATAHAARSTRNAARLLADCAERAIAFVHGACIGAGAELPAFARRVVATPDSFFQLPEVGMGLVPGSGGTVSLPRRIGRQRTARLALSGERLDAETAYAWGLVDEIVPHPTDRAGTDHD